MSDRQLVKEIITTETEKYTEEGKVKEKIKETREKIYSYDKIENYDKVDKIINKTEFKKEEVKEESKEDLIKQAAQMIEGKRPQEEQSVITDPLSPPQSIPTQPSSPAFQPTTAPPYMPQYNVLARNPVVEKPTFPWENK